MNTLENLKSITTLNEFAKLLGYQPKMLSYLLYKLPDTEKYYSFDIPKKNGGIRTINAPNEKLKLLQKKMSNLLYECYKEISEDNKNRPKMSYGFQKKLTIFDNCLNHKKRRYVFNIDLKDFFPSINFGRIRGFFIKDKAFRLNDKIATIIAQTVCYKNELPQGAPTSPIISNLLAQILDVRILKLTRRVGVRYTRYADDLTFSTNNKMFPKEIACQDNNNWNLGNKLQEIIEKAGYEVNENKTNMQYKTSRQICVGLIVNKKVNIKQEYYRKARAMCNNLFKNQAFYITEEDKEKQDNTLPQLNGILNFIYTIKRKYDRRSMTERRGKPDAITKLYKKFLLYKDFATVGKPVIFTEGKTDIIYLKCALMNMKDDYSNIIELIDNKYSYKINIIRTSRLFRDIFAIPEGTSGLKFLMDDFRKTVNHFMFNQNTQPIIFVIDNDEGAKGIKGLFGIKDNKLFHVCIPNKLYVIFVSQKENVEIEDLFGEETRKKQIDGKMFSKDKKYGDNDLYFGKQIFASKIIRPNYQTIDFNNFRPIFDGIEKILEEYKNL
jgi:retron-type reverse transcriptase